jgi:hypothetical protein
MSTESEELLLHALKVAYCYLPKAIEVNQYDYGDRVEKVLADIAIVREALLIRGVDPEEVQGEINPDGTGQSYY